MSHTNGANLAIRSTVFAVVASLLLLQKPTSDAADIEYFYLKGSNSI